MRAPLERQYVDYSRDLHRIEHGYTERDAVRMANETIAARNAAAQRAREREIARLAAEQAANETLARIHAIPKTSTKESPRQISRLRFEPQKRRLRFRSLRK